MRRIKLFSEEEEEKKKKGSAEKALDLAAGVGTGYVAAKYLDKATTNVGRKFGSKLQNSTLKAKDADSIKEKLIKEAKSQGIKVVEDKHTTNAAYVGSKSGKKLRDMIASMKKKGGKHAEMADELVRGVKRDLPSSKMWDNLGKDAIVVGKDGTLSKADVIAHEMGHAQYMRSGRSKSLLGKGSHKLTTVSKIGASKLGSTASAIHGFKSGQKSARLSKEGKKESTWNKVKSVAVPAAVVAPLLVAEGKASLNGYNRMKKLGASKELLKESRKRLGNAWGTYAAKASTPIITGELGRLSGKAYEKTKDKIKSRKSKRDHEE